MNMKWEDNGLKAPLARANGLGAAHHGSHHWMHQRVTAIANIPLMIWFVYSVVHLKGASYFEVSGWLAEPVNAILMILSVISVFYHAALGSQVIAEDYIHHEGLKLIKLIAMKLTLFALAVACIFSVLKVAL